MVNSSPAVPEIVLGDRYRIEHVIGNLLSNAIKFSPEDSEVVVEVSVEAEQSEIIQYLLFIYYKNFKYCDLLMIPSLWTTSVCVDDGSAHTVSVILLSVLDAGPGIAPSDQVRLFQNFVQIRPGQLQRGAGSGLGLTIAKQIVELHGGRIGVTSTEGQGSLFFFSIPFQQVRKQYIDGFLFLLKASITRPRIHT